MILHISPKHLFQETSTTVFATSESFNDAYTNEKLRILLAAQLLHFSAGFSPQTSWIRAMWDHLLFKKCLVTTEDFKDIHTFEKI